MKTAITDAFLDDTKRLDSALAKKCFDLLSQLQAATIEDLRNGGRPGWRLHKLQSSPFLSLSLDMNFRVLLKLTKDEVTLHRVVKHDVYERPGVNQNDDALGKTEVREARLGLTDLHTALAALGVNGHDCQSFECLKTEDDLVRALAAAPAAVAELALALYETDAILIPRVRATPLGHDTSLQRLLDGEGEWQLYLHPSQEYVVKLPHDARLSVTGSAGTGKTVCAWHRARGVAEAGHTVGFVCPDDTALRVSKDALRTLFGGTDLQCFFLVPRSADELRQLARSADCLILDEAQELPPTWLQGLDLDARKGITLFHDPNQLRSHIEAGDRSRYTKLFQLWSDVLIRHLRCIPITFGINYRNSRQIAEHYLSLLQSALPAEQLCEVPAFDGAPVLTEPVKDSASWPTRVAAAVQSACHAGFTRGQIAVIAVGSKGFVRRLGDGLRRIGVHFDHGVDRSSDLVLTTPKEFRGHERRACVVCIEDSEKGAQNWGRAIESYIALSRARELLVVLQGAPAHAS